MSYYVREHLIGFARELHEKLAENLAHMSHYDNSNDVRADRSLFEELSFWLARETDGKTQVAAEDRE